jgi:hypothetical protein
VEAILENHVAVDGEAAIVPEEAPGVIRNWTVSGRVNTESQPTMVQVRR